MNQGVDILLSRMDSNPDEFEEMYGNKWNWVLEGVHNRIMGKDKTSLAYLNDAEVQSLFDKLQELKRDRFTKMVMSTLLKEEEEQEEYMRYKPKSYGTKILAPANVADDMLKLLESKMAEAQERMK